MASLEQAQQTKYRSLLGVAIAISLCIVISIGTYLSYAYPDANATPKVIKQQEGLTLHTQALEARVQALEKKLKELEEFKKSIGIFLDLKQRITQ